MREFYITITERDDRRTTIQREAQGEKQLVAALEREFPNASFQISERNRELPEERIITDWEAEGRRIALESMDLPDGAHFAMADELGVDPY